MWRTLMKMGFLFTKDMLLAGSNGVSIIVSRASDTPSDKAAIIQGFNESR